jgi:hypothetical protein
VRRVAAQPNQLFVDVGAGDDAHDFLGHGGGVALHVRRQQREPLAQPRVEAVLPQPGLALEVVDERRERRQPRVEVALQESALGRPHDHQRVERLRHRGLDERERLVGRTRLRRALVAHLEDLRHAERVRHREAALDEPAVAGAGHRRGQPLEERLVEGHVQRRRLGQLERDGHVDPPPRQPLLHQRLDPRLDRAERGRRLHLHVQEAVVHRLEGHADRAGRRLAAHRGESRHRSNHDRAPIRPPRPTSTGRSSNICSA